MLKKGISLIILVITIVLILILSGTVAYKITDMTNEIEEISFETKISIIEKAIKVEKGSKKLSDDNYYPGILIDSSYNQHLIQIEEINNKYNIDIIGSNKYYYINTKNLLELNIKDIEGEYLVNYEEGIVFSLNPLITEDESVYTTQDI